MAIVFGATSRSMAARVADGEDTALTRLPEHHSGMAGEHAAEGVSDTVVSGLDLARAALAAELAHSLDEQEDAEHPGMAVREPAAGRVHGQLASRPRSCLDQSATVPLGAEAEVFEADDRVDGERVVDLDDVHVAWSEPGHLPGGGGRGGRRRRGGVAHGGDVAGGGGPAPAPHAHWVLWPAPRTTPRPDDAGATS